MNSIVTVIISRLAAAGFPVALLPRTVSAGTKVGETVRVFCGLPSGVSVYVAAGDAQCSVASTQHLPHQAGTQPIEALLTSDTSRSQPHYEVVCIRLRQLLLLNYYILIQG